MSRVFLIEKKRIALNLREQGRSKSEPGRLRCLQGIGWWLDEANLAQISLNLTDYDQTPIHVVYEEVIHLAALVISTELANLSNYRH